MSRQIPPPPSGFTVIPPPPAGFSVIDQQQPNVYQDASGKWVDRRATSQPATVASQAAKFPTRPKYGVESGESMTGTETAVDQAKSNVVGALQLPGTVARAGFGLAKGALGLAGDLENNPWGAFSRLKQAGSDVAGAVKTAVEPARTLARNVVALDDAYRTNWQGTQATAPTAEENRGMAEATGANAMGLAIPPAANLVGKGVNAGVTAARGTQTVANWADKLKARSTVNQTRALQPTTLEHKAVARRIAPELAKREVGAGLTGKAYDADVLSRLDDAGTRLAEAQTRIMAENANPAYQTPRAQIVGEINGAIDKLRVKGSGTIVNPEALAELKALKAQLETLPAELSPETLIDLSRKLGDRVDDLGGFKATGPERVKVQVIRGVDNLIRAAKNNLPDPDWKAANQEYALFKNATDIIKRRELGEVGKSGLMLPGRGTVLDDILATWAGSAIGGVPGAVAAEGVNLIRQGRGVAGAVSRVQSQAAKALKPSVFDRIRNPRQFPTPPPYQGPVDQFANPSGVAPRGGIEPIIPPPAGAPNQFASPSGITPGPRASVTVNPPPMDQFAQPSGVRPTLFNQPNPKVPQRIPPVGKSFTVAELESAKPAAKSMMESWATEIESADTGLTGKLKRSTDYDANYGTNPSLERFGGGYKEGTPLADFKESPGVLAKAIRSGKGNLYQEILTAFQKAAAAEIPAYAAREGVGIASPVARQSVFDQIRRKFPPK